jgi:hypothetical protein
MWEPRRLTTLWASTACYRNSFSFLLGKFWKCSYMTIKTLVQLIEYKGKVISVQVVEALRVARGWGSHIFQTFGSQMEAMLPTLGADRFLPPVRFLVLISVRGWVDPGSRTGNLPACSIVPQPATLPRAPTLDRIYSSNCMYILVVLVSNLGRVTGYPDWGFP